MKTILTLILLLTASTTFAANIDPNDDWNVYCESDPAFYEDQWNVYNNDSNKAYEDCAGRDGNPNE